MQDEMTVEDAVNVANVLSDVLAHHPEQEVRDIVIAARQLVRHVADHSRELERERARRRSLAREEASAAEGHRLEEGADRGGRRDFLAGRAVHAGDVLYILTCAGWHPVRYESNMPRKASVLYVPLPGVGEEVVIAVPREALFAWPEELQRN